MPKTLPFLLVIAALILAACSSPAATSAVTLAPPAASLPAGATAPAQATGAAESKCSAVSQLPTAGPTEASLFPAVGSSDWVRGAETAAVTFIEYGDYQ